MDDMLVTRYGHAALLVESGATRILIDPGTFSRDAVFDLTGLDAIVVTHQHPDHVDPDRIGGLLEANPGATLLADPETAERLGSPWRAHRDGELTLVGDLELTGVGEWHAVIAEPLPRVANVGVLVTASGEPTLFHPGDSYAVAPPEVDVLAVPLSAPWTKVAETIEFVGRVGPKVMFPIHDCTVSEAGHGVYWQHVSRFGGVPDARDLPQDGTLDM
ncbi:MBL fold metallo-hydrolase [Aeromicrobium sp. YIM 150415]|uniref:MBL fold metallo-hydrolase n=1 Tax=Aeromicrobium sp. YIM 150415 TaxID=2803912 RepID=UPI001964952A|nr:MBL fold metallo-hydrolase [Aeromicrobium sp. YIM 150415]MBM9462522.1 MBL fold metallo-hydrolase [Aeromicrobium sp. YIM 150415]